jgi:hypothetical protein
VLRVGVFWYGAPCHWVSVPDVSNRASHSRMPETCHTNFSLTGIQGLIAQGTGNNYSHHRHLLYIICPPPVISLQSGNKLNFSPKIKRKHFYGFYFKTCGLSPITRSMERWSWKMSWKGFRRMKFWSKLGTAWTCSWTDWGKPYKTPRQDIGCTVQQSTQQCFPKVSERLNINQPEPYHYDDGPW